MIQRLQHFLLVLAACGIVLMFMFPTAHYTFTFPGTQNEVTSDLGLIAKHSVFDSDGVSLMPVYSYLGQQDVPFKGALVLTALAAIIGVLCIVVICFYKNRVLQMRLMAFTMLFNVVYIFLLFFWVVDAYGKALMTIGIEEPVPQFSVGTWTPIVTLVLLIFAQRGIKKDEMKVRAADRLR